MSRSRRITAGTAVLNDLVRPRFRIEAGQRSLAVLQRIVDLRRHRPGSRRGRRDDAVLFVSHSSSLGGPR